MAGRDNTEAYAGLRRQLPPSPARAHYVKARVKVRAYPDGEFAIFHGPRPDIGMSAAAAPANELGNL